MFTLAKALGLGGLGLAQLGTVSGLLPYTIIHKMEGGISKI
jgi:hypothetical protein